MAGVETDQGDSCQASHRSVHLRSVHPPELLLNRLEALAMAVEPWAMQWEPQIAGCEHCLSGILNSHLFSALGCMC